MEKHFRTISAVGTAVVMALWIGSASAQELAVEQAKSAPAVPVKASAGMALQAYRAKDYERAYQLFEAVEHENSPMVVFQLGFMDMIGEGTKRNLKSAKDRYERACELEFAMACLALSSLEERGM